MSTPLRTRILLADDHAVVRQGLRMVLDREPDLAVVAEASDGAEAVTLALAGGIDLAILDVSMPKRSGLHAAREITRQRPGLRVVLLSMHDNEQYLFEALRAGAAAYVLKSAVDQELVAACRVAMRGEPFLYPTLVSAVLREHLEAARRGGGRSGNVLTPRESEVVKLVAEGHSSRAIGEILGISAKTVERHRSNVLDKLELSDRVALTRYAIRHGMIEP